MNKFKLLRIPADERLRFLQERLAEGRITRFSEIFMFLSKTAIATMMSMKVERFSKCFHKDPGGFKFAQFFKLAEKIEVDPWLLIKLFESEIKSNSPDHTSP